MLISEDCLINYVRNTLAKCNEDAYLPSLHLSTVLELRRKLREKLRRVTWTTAEYCCQFPASVLGRGCYPPPPPP